MCKASLKLFSNVKENFATRSKTQETRTSKIPRERFLFSRSCALELATSELPFGEGEVTVVYYMVAEGLRDWTNL